VFFDRLFGLLLRLFTFIPILLNISIVYTVVFNTLFTICPFKTKMWSNFYFWTEIVFLIGQVNFFLEWPKEECVSLLAAFC
jgi:hypothetical protein